MANIPAPPLVLSVSAATTMQPTICRPKPETTDDQLLMSPFSAVAPPPFLAVSRLNIRLTLETIYEEETEEDFNESTSSSSSSSCCQTQNSFMMSTCFFQVEKPFLASALKI
ncbi:hypothetical protein ACOSQ2_011830 [Xanthoceras sorbifolium]